MLSYLAKVVGHLSDRNSVMVPAHKHNTDFKQTPLPGRPLNMRVSAEAYRSRFHCIDHSTC